MKKPIGIFDSGIGGLTVLKEILNAMPGEDTIYLGDTARVPYGAKSAETVTRYSLENARFLLKFDIKLLVVACNTASAYCLPRLKQELPIPVIGVIEPGARKAVEVTKTKRVGVIGTEGTIRSGAYFDAIKAINPAIAVFIKPCPLFVPLAEEGWTNNQIARLTAQTYLHYIKKQWIDTLILGCTHYPLFKGVISDIMGEDVMLIDSGHETAAEVFKCLMDKNLLETVSSGQNTHRFFVTDSPERFKQVGSKFMTANLDAVELVNVGS
ncbi:MAG: glutamate racemase [Deltaproteobacteria bacterium]|nr:glutamate racemase [Deltaproteobacteria bacterium]